MDQKSDCSCILEIIVINSGKVSPIGQKWLFYKLQGGTRHMGNVSWLNRGFSLRIGVGRLDIVRI